MFGINNNNNDDSASRSAITTILTDVPSISPTILNVTESFIEAELASEEHEFDAISALLLNLVIIGCLILAYFLKANKIYYLPESAGFLCVGMVIGLLVRLTTTNLTLFEFSPEVFFFVLLPPIIFEAGYSLDRKGFFDNIGAITLYAMLGTFISTFVVGLACFYCAKLGLIRDIDKTNPMESLMFGALISAVDPVATLSIMGNAELGVDPLLYSLVFGESVLNDAIAISLFKVFFKYYNPDGPNWNESEIPTAMITFVVVSAISIGVGVGLGLLASWIYKHTNLQQYPNLECSLLLCFCYLCYATAEAIEMSGIMALFFQGIVLSHYNSYNLSSTAHVASEQIFSTFATLTETIVYIYMGMGVFTGRFQYWDVGFSILAMIACLIGRLLNIVPLSYVANICRRNNNIITAKTQAVLWFAGLRGAIAFALSENMPGPHKEIYATTTLSICIFTTIVCGGFTDRILSVFGMKEEEPFHMTTNNSLSGDDSGEEEHLTLNRLTFKPPPPSQQDQNQHGRSSRILEYQRQQIRKGIKGVWDRFDNQFLKPHFGGEGMSTATATATATTTTRAATNGHNTHITTQHRNGGDHLGNYELGSLMAPDDDEDHTDSDRYEDD